MSTKVNELTPKVDRYTVTDPDGQLSATEYNVVLDAVQRHEKQLTDNDFLRFSEQTLDDNDKRQARQNIGVVGEGDYAPKMSVGFADNLIGRGEATAEEFTYRASAGMDRSITDDTARMKKIKGNSVVWNQMCNHQLYSESQTKNGVTLTPNGDGSFSIETDANGATELTRFNVSSLEITGLSKHKILIAGAPIGSSRSTYYLIDNFTGNYCFDSVIFTKNSASGKGDCYIEVVRGCVITTPVIFKPQYIDLTKMFGAGNEPTTVEEFYTRIPSGIDIFAYNEGEIISMNTEAIKTVGFNQWDEEVVYDKTIDFEGNLVSGNYICSKNFIPILPNTTYYCKRPRLASGGYMTAYYIQYDENKKTIGSKNIYINLLPNNTIFTTLTPEARYIRIMVSKTEYGSTYNHDICINLSHTGTENGKYKPYTPFTRELPIIKKYFPNGMRSAGTAFDSIEWNSIKQKWVAVQRIGEVDLGGLQWSKNDSYGFYISIAALSNISVVKDYDTIANMLCEKYTTSKVSDVYQQSEVNTIGLSPTHLAIGDLTYDTTENFTSAMQGVMLYYELAEPDVNEIEEEFVNFDYYVEDFGTEEALGSVPSAPFRADVVYTFNAVDTIRNNYLAIEKLKKQMAQMQNTISAMQTAQVKGEE